MIGLGCAFCDFIYGDAELPRHFRDVDEHCVIFEPLDPFQSGHRLVVPKLHVRDATTSSETTALTFATAAGYVDGLGEPANILTSVGREATQTVMHFHIHVIPRGGRSDTLARGWPWRQK